MVELTEEAPVLQKAMKPAALPEGEREKAKVIVASGFLGSGKTTMIERILKAPSLTRRWL